MEPDLPAGEGLTKEVPYANLNTLRIAFSRHVYQENQETGGTESLRERIMMAQIMGLHRESTYITPPLPEQQIRR
jgi:hypothetical protein